MSSNKEKAAKITLFALTWPIFVEILLHMLMGNVDTIMLSQYNDNAVASVGVSNQIMSVIIVMFGFVAAGTTILIAQNIGAKKKEKASQISVVSIAANLLFGILLSLSLLLFGKPVLLAMNIPEELIADSLIYLQIVGGTLFIQSVIMTLGAVVKSYGFTKDAMYVTLGMNILNVIGNYVLIFGAFGAPELGVTGVAISTAISRAIGLVILFICLYKRVNGYLPWNYLFEKFPKEEIQQLLKIGIPSAGEQLAYNLSQMVITAFIATMGTVELTTRVYAFNIIMFAMLFSIAIGQGTQILIGYLVGEKQINKAYERCLKSLWIGVAISTFFMITLSLFRETLLSLFTSNPEIIQIGSLLLLISIILEPGRAFNLIVINALRAAGDVRYPAYIGIICMWGVSVTVSYTAGIMFGLGLIGVWIAMILDEWIRGILMLRRWNSKKWVTMSFVNEEGKNS
ncbi:MATE family efflux transporter [Evansella cellulosilytica]|uniref:MATE efflux family protein n=1 Tax=Evansella cellulosilytica (strain ATCC 21833 / DSM 2522 / FERM P-1141 / JCM 9156 / N-4) TaxID=649639 RepID=E6TY08_EVAC2|nr:MATE family efflux transporter [Evansella cellulosilytica]ADU31221.1 MATE efflux family protein [Evansella cellulosilytica DSM 2522]